MLLKTVTDLTPSKLSHDKKLLTLDLSYNPLGGEIPGSMLSTFTPCNLELYLDHCNLNGTIPVELIYFNTFPELTLSLASNLLVGPFPELLLRNLPPGLTKLSLTFDNNELGGELKSNSLALEFASTHPPLVMCIISLSNTSLSRSIPSAALTGVLTYVLRLDHNFFTGTLPLASMLTSPTLLLVSIDVGQNRLGDVLTIPPPQPSGKPFLLLTASGNNFVSLNANMNVDTYLQYLDISNNPALTGTLPPSIFASNQLTTLNASNTALSGTLPSLSSDLRTTTNFDLSSTKIDMCTLANDTFVANALTSCSLDFTSAVTCFKKFPSNCFPKTDFAALGCSAATRPSPAFVCINGIWTFFGDVGSGTLIIPGSGSTTVIQGNLGSSGVVLQGSNTSIVIYGCANNLTSITVSLTQEEIRSLGSQSNRTLIILAGNVSSCAPLNNITINTQVAGGGCRRFKSTSTTASQGNLSALFTTDSSRCNRWWIILVSVVCGVVVLAAVIFALLVAFVPRVRTAVRPYSSRGKQANTGGVN